MAENGIQDSEQLKQIKLNSAKKLLTELPTEELEGFSMGVETELSKRDPTALPKWNHIKEYKDEIEEAIRTWGKVGGISSGLPSLDAVIGGLRKGQTLLVAGESNQGKSALAAQIAVNVSRQHKVGYISLEMLPGDNGARINHMNGGTLDGLDIYFQSTTDIDYKHLDPLFKQAKEQGFELVMLDYLQFLGRDLTMDEVAKMSKTIKRMATKYKMPFIVIVSLRKGMQRKWTDIMLDDLMGTSAIGYDSDNTIVVSRNDMENEYDEDHIFIKVLKLRNMKRTKDNQYLMYDWHDTRVTEPAVPLHLMNPDNQVEGDIDENGKLSTGKD